MHTRILFNPEAGGLRRGCTEKLARAVDVLAAQGIEAEIEATPGPATAGQLARSMAEVAGVQRILVAGGDGTLNEVINGVVGLPVEVGLLPAGTANVLANEMGVGRWQQALQKVSSWQPVAVPTGVLHFADGSQRHFLMMAGAGFDARMVSMVDPAMKRRFGKLAYWMTGLSQLGRKLEQVRLTANGRVYRGSFCLASRVRNYGGDLQIAPSIRLMDDDLEVVVFEATVTATYLAHLAKVVAGRIRSAQGITVFRTRELSLAPDGDEPVHVQVDGEYAGLLPLRITVHPAAINLLVPPAYLQRHLSRAA